MPPVSPLQSQLVQGALSTLNTLNPFATLRPGYNDPKPLPGETPFAYNHRMSVLRNAQSLSNVGVDIDKGATYLFGSEAAQQKQRANTQAVNDLWKNVPAVMRENASAAFDNSLQGLTDGLIKRGIPGHIARGVAAGLLGESAGDINAFNPAGGGQGAYGLGQLRGPRQANLRARYGDRPTGDQQLDYLAWELKGGDRGGASVMAARTPDEALQAFIYNFQRPGADAANLLQRSSDLMYGRPGQPGALRSPFDPAYINRAAGFADQAAQHLLTPSQITTAGIGPMPEQPRPEPIPKTDFSAAETNLEALRPVEFTEKEARNLHWSNFWSGLGKAMASSPEGEGLGSLFLRLGGGALMAKGATKSDIQARKDAYDTKLAKFNAALYEHNMGKAQTLQNELLADWQATETWVQNKFKQEFNIWASNSRPQLIGTDIVTNVLDPKTGASTITRTPVRELVLAENARQKAGLAERAFGVHNAANAQMTGIGNRINGQIVLGQVAEVMADENAAPGERAAAAYFGPMAAVQRAVDGGMLSSIYGEDELEAMVEDATQSVTTMGIRPVDKGWNEAIKNAVIGRVLVTLSDQPTLDRLMATTGPGSAADLFEQYTRANQVTRTQQTRTKAGNSVFTETERYEGDE